MGTGPFLLLASFGSSKSQASVYIQNAEGQLRDRVELSGLDSSLSFSVESLS